MLPVTLAIITRNEEERISAAIESAGDVAEVLVLDSGSTDRTVEIAHDLGARVEVLDWPGYGAQKNRALQMSQQPWGLSLDADENLGPELLQSLIRLFEDGPHHDGYALLRRNHWAGKAVRALCERVPVDGREAYSTRPWKSKAKLVGCLGFWIISPIVIVMSSNKPHSSMQCSLRRRLSRRGAVPTGGTYNCALLYIL